ncbi:hypothetical protein, partial [Dyadobacter diqingensis]|uniref:hypothetical protein n=1 Tax=Dyadobacter diqingensis TaxID=2938121 RepID=UPI0020C1D565
AFLGKFFWLLQGWIVGTRETALKGWVRSSGLPQIWGLVSRDCAGRPWRWGWTGFPFGEM